MTGPDNLNQSPEDASFREKLAALKHAARRCPSPVRTVTPVRDIDPRSGQIWQTQKSGGDPETAPESYDPCWVVLLEQFDDYGELMFQAAPIFTETEMASAEDVIMPRHLLGFDWAAAIGTVITVLPGSLRNCEGILPDEWRDKLLAFYRAVSATRHESEDEELDPETAIAPQAVPGIQVGLPYVDQLDPAFEFHTELVERLDYLQQPVWEWAHQPAKNPVLQELVAAIKAKVSERLTIPWIPELQLWRAELYAAGKGDEEERFWGKAEFVASDLNVFLSVTPEGSDSCSFFVSDHHRNTSHALDGCFIVGSHSKTPAQIENARATLAVDEVVDGLVVANAAGDVLRLDAFDNDDQLRDRVAKSFGNIAILSDNQLSAYRRWFPSPECFPEVLGELLFRHWLYRKEEVSEINAAVEELITPGVRSHYERISLLPRHKLASDHEVLRSSGFNSSFDERAWTYFARRVGFCLNCDGLIPVAVADSAIAIPFKVRSDVAAGHIVGLDGKTVTGWVTEAEGLRQSLGRSFGVQLGCALGIEADRRILRGGSFALPILLALARGNEFPAGDVIATGAVAASALNKVGSLEKKYRLARRVGAKLFVAPQGDNFMPRTDTLILRPNEPIQNCLTEIWREIRARGIASTSEAYSRTLIRSVCNETGGRRLRPECDFTAVIADLSEGLIGRGSQLAQAKAWIDTHRQQGGALWITGAPGAGKSAFMAALATGLSSRSDVFVVPYFFGRAVGKTLADFCNCAVERLAGHYDLDLTDNRSQPAAHIRLHDALSKALPQLASKEENLIFVLDGLNEATEADFAKLSLATVTPRITWVCAGLSFPSLAPVYEHAEAFGKDGNLGPLYDEDVRSWLTAELQKRVTEQFGEPVWNNFSEEVVRYAKGLPLFVSTIIDDVRNQTLDLAQAGAVPHSLADYYDRLCLSVDQRDGVLLNIFSLLALSQSGDGISEDTLEYLLQSNNLRNTRAWSDIFAKALRQGRAFLRRVKRSDDSQGWTLYHDAFRQHLLSPTTNNPWVEVGKEQWLGACRAWPACEREMRIYALRYFDSHLRLAGAEEKQELYNLARNEDFLTAQGAEFYDEPWHPLETIRSALRAAIEHRDMPEIIEFSFGCAHRRGSTLRESPLDIIRRAAGDPASWKRAKSVIAQLEERDDQLVWHLVLAAECGQRTSQAIRLMREIPSGLWHGRFDPEHQQGAIVLLSLLRGLSGIERQWDGMFKRLTPDGQRMLCVLTAQQGQLSAARSILQEIKDWPAQTRARREVIKALLRQADFKAAREEIAMIVVDEQASPGLKQQAQDEQAWAQVDLADAFARAGDFREAWAITDSFARHQGWQKARSLQHIGYAQYCRYGKATRFSHTLEKAQTIINHFGKRTKARALAELGATQARVGHQSIGSKMLQAGLEIALGLQPSDDQLQVLIGILRNIDSASTDNPAFSWFFDRTVERLLLDSSRWDSFPKSRNDLLKLITKLQAGRGDFTKAFETLAKIRGNDIRAQAYGEIGAALYEAGEPAEELLLRLPLRSRLVVASSIAIAVTLGRRPRDARFIIARQLHARAWAQTDHRWGKPRLLGALAAGFAREKDSLRAEELFSEALRRIGKISSMKSRIYSLCNLAIDHATGGDFQKAREVFVLAKRHAKRMPLALTSVAAREAEAGFAVEAKASLDEVTARLPEWSDERPQLAAEICGELAAAHVRLEQVDKAEAAFERAVDLVSSLKSPKIKAPVASKLATEAAKAAIRVHSLSEWAERFLQLSRETCERTKGSRDIVHEPNRLIRAESVLLAIRGFLEAGIVKARRIRNAEQQPRALRDLAMFCIEQKDFSRAFDLVASVTQDPSEMVPDVARELAAHGNVDLSLRLVPLAVDHFDAAYRLADYIIRHIPATLTELEKTLAWFRRDEAIGSQ